MPENGTELAIPAPQRDGVDSWVAVIRPVITLSEHVADTEFVPRGMRGNPPAIAAAILHGRELGLPPMTALAQTHVIDGRPTLSAEGQRGLVLAAGHAVEFVELTDATVTIRGKRAGAERWLAVTWTLDRARQAGLLGKPRSAWATYPRAMLAARATAELCRLVFPDVLHGMAATEEMEEPETDTPRATRTRTVQRTAPPPAPMPTAPAISPPEGHTEPGAAVIPMPDPPDDTDTVSPAGVSPAQLRMLGAMWARYGVTDEQRKELTARIVGRDLGDTTKNLRRGEASHVLELLTSTYNDVRGDGDADDPAADVALAALLERLPS